MQEYSQQSKGRNSKPLNLSTLVYGKVPPQARELEKVIIGAMLLEKNAFDTVTEILKTECFYVDAHQRVFSAMVRLQAKSSPIDIFTVIEELRTSEELDLVGGPYFITTLTNDVVSAANIQSHCRIVFQQFIKREIIRISGELLSEAYEDATDAFDLRDRAEKALFDLSAETSKSECVFLADGMPELITKIDQLKANPQEVTGVSTGYPDLNKLTQGWQETDLIILAARPSVGKTAFVLNLAVNAAKSNAGVLFFSLEMGTQQLLKRIVSADTNIWMDRITSGRIDDTTVLYKSADRIQKLPIWVDDTAGLGLMALRGKARRMVKRHKIKLIILDYLQLMQGDRGNKSGNREQEISTISRGLKILAKELKVPIIALSQLSREVEKRAKDQKTPMLSDLRESGAIEQDADIVGFLYRPDEESVKGNPDLQNTGSLKIAKHRNGALGSIAFQVDNNVQKWDEIGLMGENSYRPTSFYTNALTPVNSLPPQSDFDAGFDDQTLF